MVRRVGDANRVLPPASAGSLPRFDVFGMTSAGAPVSKSEMLNYLRTLGGTFPRSLESKLAMPENLYRKTDEDGAEVVFREFDRPLNAGDLVSTIRGQRVINQRVLAIVPHENQAYLVYVDPSRGINFSHRLGGIHSTAFDWAGVNNKLPELESSNNQSNHANRADSIHLLSHVANINPELNTLLAIPESLFIVGDGVRSNLCLSSSPDIDLSAIERLLTRGDQPSAESIAAAPDYAISFPTQGSTSFCLFIDRSRKIIVFAEIGNIQAHGGFSFDALETALTTTLERVKILASRKVKFDFVFDGETITK